jgi:hypothetical protein
MMVWILVKPDAFVEDREEAARRFNPPDEFSVKNADGEDDVEDDFGEDVAE